MLDQEKIKKFGNHKKGEKEGKSVPYKDGIIIT